MIVTTRGASCRHLTSKTYQNYVAGGESRNLETAPEAFSSFSNLTETNYCMITLYVGMILMQYVTLDSCATKWT